MKASPKPALPAGRSSPKGRTLAHKSPPPRRGWGWAVFAFAFLIYSNTLNHGYVLDDDVVFLKNKSVQAGTAGIREILSNSFTYGFTGLNDRVQSYRPVVLIVNAIEKQIFGNNPHRGHLINVLLFAFSCLLLFRLCDLLFAHFQLAEFTVSPPVPKRYVRAGSLRFTVPFLIAILYAVHPIHTEAVANIKGRDEILNFIFLVLSLTFILRHVDTSQKKYFVLSALFFFLSLLCKEIAVTFLAVIPLTVFLFRQVPVKKIIMGLVPFIAVFGLYMLIRNAVLDGPAAEEKMKVVNNALAAAANGSERIATALLILGKYLLLLLFPHPLSWDYSFNQVPIVSLSNVNVIIVILLIGAMVVFSLRVLLNKIKRPETRNQEPETRIQKPETIIYVYCILFFIITISVVSNLFLLIGATMGERFLFTPSLAFCMAVPFLLMKLNTKVVLPVTAVLLALFSFKTFTRNKDWKDNYSLFLSGVEAAPNSSRVQSSLGSSYREQAEQQPDMIQRGNLYGKAIEQYLKAIKILPENTEALYNLGVCYYAIGDRESALKVYEKTLAVSPDYTSAANNLGVIYFERKEYETAKNYFEQALKYSPNNSDALGNLGAIHHNLGNLPEAIDYYRKALAINPNNPNVQANLKKAEGTSPPAPLQRRGG